MQTHDTDEVSLGEIVRTLNDFRHEFRNFAAEVVRKDVYSAHMAHMQLQIDNLNKAHHRMLEERDSDRRQVRNAFLTAGSSIVVMVVTLVLQILVK